MNNQGIWAKEFEWGQFDFPQMHMGKLLGIEIKEIGETHLTATMPINEKTIQPFGILHGGATCVLAESIGSMASIAAIGGGKKVVGLNLSANYVRPASGVEVTAICVPVKIGKSIHIWRIEVYNELEKLIADIQFTTMILDET